MPTLSAKAKKNDARLALIEKSVSDAIKMHGRWARYDVAKKFARKMRAHIDRIKQYGTGNPIGEGQRVLGREIINAMTWGIGAKHENKMLRRYEAAARAAERFCR